MIDVAGTFLNKLRPIDPLNLVKRMTNECTQAAKIEIAKALIQEYPEEFSINDFQSSLSKGLTYLFNEYARYINIDIDVEKLGRISNVNLISLFDCCREKPATRGNPTDIALVYSKDGSIIKCSERLFGMSANFYAK
jgi:hypothetical protein